MDDQIKVFHPFAGNHDPCTPIPEKTYMTPPQLYMKYQPGGEEQYAPKEALLRGTLWPALFSPYVAKRNLKGE